MRSLIKKLFYKITSLVKKNKYIDGYKYWSNRAHNYGKHSVLNLAHPFEDFEKVTQQQKAILFPLLKALLNGSESSALDFGRGPGRFTSDLAALSMDRCLV